MKIKVLLPIYNFQLLGPEEGIYIECCNISKRQQHIDEFAVDDDDRNFIGGGPLQQIGKYFRASLSLETDDVKLASHELYEINHDINGEINMYAFYLWFIKDNSVFIKDSFLKVLDDNNLMNDTRGTMISNCIGQYSVESFEHSQIVLAYAIAKKAMAIANFGKRDIAVKPEFNAKSPMFLGDINVRIYDADVNRIARSLNFLYMARSNSYLPQKISFYMCIVESLFNVNVPKNELSDTICLRAARYIEITHTRDSDAYKIFREGYKVRSSYVHGNVLQYASLAEIQRVSRELDKLIRWILMNIIMNDDETFTKDDIQLGKYLKGKFDSPIVNKKKSKRSRK